MVDSGQAKSFHQCQGHFGTMGCNSTRMAELQMSEREKEIVRESWTKFRAHGELQNLGIPMFMKLFADYPDVKHLFSFVRDGADSPEHEAFRIHAGNVMGIVDIAVKSLDDIPKLQSTVTELGGKHTPYGTRIAHLQPVGICLIHTLEQKLGGDFTPQVKEAWVHLYAIISEAFARGLQG